MHKRNMMEVHEARRAKRVCLDALTAGEGVVFDLILTKD